MDNHVYCATKIKRICVVSTVELSEFLHQLCGLRSPAVLYSSEIWAIDAKYKSRIAHTGMEFVTRLRKITKEIKMFWMN
jgi:hypothetical protein